MAPDFSHTVNLRPRRGRTHIMLGGALGDRVTLCGCPCDGWAVSPDAPTCKRCIVINEINNLPAVEEPDDRTETRTSERRGTEDPEPGA